MIVNFIIPGDIDLPTGGYRYDKRILHEWQQIGLECNLISLNGDFPFPEKLDIQNAISQIAEFPKADICVVDGLAGGAMPQFMERLKSDSPVIALIHHPLCMENGLTTAQAEQLSKLENDGLRFVNGVATTSPTTSETVSELFSSVPEAIETILPGVERGEISKPYLDGPFHLLCIASLIERKGHRFLIDALSNLKELNWVLDCYGMMNQDSAIYEATLEQIERLGLADRIKLHGSVKDDQIKKAYAEAHLFVLPSLYEGYGMAFAEAIVRGLPVIGTTAGAIPKTVPDTCGMLVEPENSKSLAQALHLMLSDKDVLKNYRAGAIEASAGFPSWRSSAVKFKNFLEKWA